MNEAITSEAATAETLTLQQIEAHYPDEWVLIENPELDDDLEIIRGRVIAHDADRAVISRYDKHHRPKSAAYLWTGELPEIMALNL